MRFLCSLHNNGRMLDIYWRLMGKEEDFFIPHDLELSNEELAFITRKSEQWRGEEGERRKVAVYDYIWEEEEVKLQLHYVLVGGAALNFSAFLLSLHSA